MDTTSEIKPNKPLVSILMLTYNRATYIKAAIQSVLAQTYPHFKLHIIDDGSTDDTPTLIAQFTDARIHYHRHEENAGLIPRRQESLTYATGTYTAVLDSDDVWCSPNKLGAQVAHLEANPDCVVVGTYINHINHAGDVLNTDHYATTDRAIRRRILARNQFAHSSVVMRTASIQKTAGYQDTGLAEDLDLFLQLGQLGTFANLPYAYTSYRLHEQSFGSQRQQMAQAVIKIIKKHRHHYPNALPALSKAYLRLLLRYLRY